MTFFGQWFGSVETERGHRGAVVNVDFDRGGHGVLQVVDGPLTFAADVSLETSSSSSGDVAGNPFNFRPEHQLPADARLPTNGILKAALTKNAAGLPEVAGTYRTDLPGEHAFSFTRSAATGSRRKPVSSWA